MACAIADSLTRPARARTPCFLKGTKILTASGERPVESLQVGDLVSTVFGRERPIEWITRYRSGSRGRSPWARADGPVCIQRSALADNIPHADLYVTAGHAVLVDGLLVPAGSLINGITIFNCGAEGSDDLEFFQVKLVTHDVIYAEGAPCETMLRIGKSDEAFEAYSRRHEQRRDNHCAPIVCNGMRAELRSRARSALSPWLGPQKLDIVRERLELRALHVQSVAKVNAAVTLGARELELRAS